ncbi:MAG: hypothetical protein PF689_14555 [Deltaproteobacteria bacterium]|jgi:hypothetical protein|nr:hypothetical protein [Deltaproteobacteria bacterium]
MNKKPEQIIASFSLFRKSKFILLLLLLLVNSSCTFFRVGKMLKYDFAPAFKEGDPKKISSYSTRRFGKVLNKFNQHELKTILNFGQDSDSSGKTSSDDFSYESFSHKGKRAVFKVESNGSTIRFICKNEKGDWKVDDIIIKNLGNTFSLRDILGIFHTIKKVVEKLQQNTVPRTWLSPQLAKATEVFLPYSLHYLKDFQLFPKKKKKEKKKKEKNSFIKKFNLDTTNKGGKIQFETKLGEFRIDLQRKIDFWKIQKIAVKPPDKPIISLSALSKYFHSILEVASFVLFKNKHPNTEKKFQLFLQLFSPKFKKSFKKTAPLLQNFLASLSFSKLTNVLTSPQKGNTKISDSKIGNSWQQYLNLFHYEFVRDNLFFRINSKKFKLEFKLSPQGKIADIILKYENHKIELDDLISFIPWYSVLAKFNTIPATPGQRRAKLNSLLDLLHENHLTGIKEALPNEISTKWWKLISKLLTKSDGRKSAKNHNAALDFNLNSAKKMMRDFHFSSDQSERHLQVKLQIKNQPLLIKFSRSSYKWQLASIKLPGTNSEELLQWIKLLPFVINLSEGLMQTNSGIFLKAFSSDFAANLKSSWELLFKLHGKKLKKLFGQVQELALKRVDSHSLNLNKKTENNQANTEAFTFPRLEQKGKLLTLSFKKDKLFFRKNSNHNWGLAYSDSLKIDKKNQFQFIELVPMLISYYYGLRSLKKHYLRKFSSYKFNRNIWNRISRKQLESTFQRFNIQIPAITPELIVDSLLPQNSTSPATPGADNSVDLRSFHFYRYRRWPFAEIMLTVDGRKLDLQYGWQKKQKRWVLRDIKVEQSFLGKISLLKNLPLLLKKK